MRISAIFLLVLALSIPGAAEAQFTGGNDRGRSIPDRDDRDSNETGNRAFPRRVTRTPTPEIVTIVPSPKRTPARRAKPKPKPKVTKRLPRPLPGKAVLGVPDIIHSIRTPMIRPQARLLPDGRFEYIVLGPGSETAAAITALTDAGAILLRQRAYPNLDRNALIIDPQTLTLTQMRDLLAGAAPTTEVDTHAIYRFAAGGTPRLYAAALVNPPNNPTCTLTGKVRIGQIDGPIAPDHAALRDTGVLVHSVLGDAVLVPRKDHGTAVAALLTGQDATGALAGFATGAQLLSVSAFGAEGASGASDIERISAALDWLAGERAQIINLSFAGPVNRALDVALKVMASKNIILIAAAGNGGSDQAVYPAAADAVIGVTAIDAALRRYQFANTGAQIEFAAPGVDLYVATQDGGSYASGTSYAAPILTGLAARLVAQGVTDAPTMRARLQGQSVDLGDSGRDSAFGWGLVKASGC